jgi:hypothetical protein
MGVTGRVRLQEVDESRDGPLENVDLVRLLGEAVTFVGAVVSNSTLWGCLSGPS